MSRFARCIGFLEEYGEVREARSTQKFEPALGVDGMARRPQPFWKERRYDLPEESERRHPNYTKPELLAEAPNQV